MVSPVLALNWHCDGSIPSPAPPSKDGFNPQGYLWRSLDKGRNIMTVYKVYDIDFGVYEAKFVARVKKPTVLQVRNWAERTMRADSGLVKIEVRMKSGVVAFS